jgi:hypothetical protein
MTAKSILRRNESGFHNQDGIDAMNRKLIVAGAGFVTIGPLVGVVSHSPRAQRWWFGTVMHLSHGGFLRNGGARRLTPVSDLTDIL